MAGRVSRKQSEERYLKLMQAAADGIAMSKVAAEMNLSPDSIKNMFSKLHRKYEASNRVHLIAIALRRGLID